MEEGYAQRYRELYQGHWWWMARERFLLKEIGRAQAEKLKGPVLDVGCGDGLFFDRLLELGEVEGLELDAELIDPKGPHRHRIRVGPFDKRFAPGKRYSMVLMLDVLEHLSDPADALRRAWLLLDHGGVLLVTVPAFNLLWTHHDVLNHHHTRYTRRTLLELADRTGVPIEYTRYFFHWLFPAKLLARLWESVMGGDDSGPRIPPSWLNRSLYGLTRLEQAALNAVPLPFGSSLLAVARKPALSADDQP